MRKTPTTIVGKAVRAVSRLRGGGSALPGLVVEKVDKTYVPSVLATLPKGVVIISGTNGKTTTTKMVVELLESQGLKVFTNRTGSNFVRGVAAALISEVSVTGKLTADIAVLELDEAHAVHFVKVVKPRYSLLLNVMRDQLDRFGEIDTTAKMLQVIAETTTEKVILNREDPRLVKIAGQMQSGKCVYYGLDASLLSLFPSDDAMRGKKNEVQSGEKVEAYGVLESVSGANASLWLGKERFETSMLLDGVYNIFNAVGALTLSATILGDNVRTGALIKRLSTITPAFGRGEKLVVNGQPLELVLVKNPGGFRLGLKSFDSKGYATMIAINDNYADGRDMSWLWDVDFNSLEGGVEMVSGIRCYDMVVRLQYDLVSVKNVEPELPKALSEFIKNNPDSPKRIYCTYTAMLALRKEISKITEVEKVL